MHDRDETLMENAHGIHSERKLKPVILSRTVYLVRSPLITHPGETSERKRTTASIYRRECSARACAKSRIHGRTTKDVSCKAGEWKEVRGGRTQIEKREYAGQERSKCANMSWNEISLKEYGYVIVDSLRCEFARWATLFNRTTIRPQKWSNEVH